MATRGTRDTGDVLDRLRRQDVEHELIVIEDTDGKGACWARNEGVKRARGEFYYWLDDDIFLEPGALKNLVSKLRNHPEASWVYSHWVRGDSDQNPVDRVVPELLFEQNYMSGVALFRACDWPGWDESLMKFQDWDVYLTLVEQGKTGIYGGERIAFTTPVLADQMSAAPMEQFWYWYCKVRTKHLDKWRTVGLFTLTRDRLDYTRDCFEALYANAGMPMTHLVIDNGSTDGTVKWLKDNQERFGYELQVSSDNLGISAGSNLALDTFAAEHPDIWFLGKFDNDCMVKTPGLIRELTGAVMNMDGQVLLSPRVIGLRHQPIRAETKRLGDHDFGITPIVGGLCHMTWAACYLDYRFDEGLPKAQGQDQDFCGWFGDNVGAIGYVEDLLVEHYESTDGQMRRYPDYFTRKATEEAGYAEYALGREAGA